MKFYDTITNRELLILDGGIGSQIMNKIPDYSGCLELLNQTMPEIVFEINSEYVIAGADIIETNTFGGSKLKLDEYNLGSKCYELNKMAAEIAKSAASSKALVAGSIGPSGHIAEPVGNTSYDELFNSFQQQARGLFDGGADLFIIETMNDMQEAKIAINACKFVADLPIVCSMTFDENGKSISGTDIPTALATIYQHGADIAGLNCGMGPVQIASLLENISEELKEMNIPFAVWANAGLPIVKDGKTLYKMSPDEFAQSNIKIAEAGAKIIGGCCGTSPDHIRELKNTVRNFKVETRYTSKNYKYATSLLKRVDLTNNAFTKIGERLNPTARKAFGAELIESKTVFLRKESVLQQSEGANILDINVGVPDIDEISAMSKAVKTLSTLVSTPLMIDSDNADVIEEALKMYPGYPIVNSINGKQEHLDKILPLIKKYGCFILALCLDDSGIHSNADKRISIGQSVVDILIKNGIDQQRIIIDPLMLTESAEPGSAQETLKVIDYFYKNKIKTSLGISNISFGLPQRKFMNNTFTSIAVEHGLSMGIVNTRTLDLDISKNSNEYKLSNNYLLGNDINATNYINHFNQIESDHINIKQDKNTVSPLDEIKEMVVVGDLDNIIGRIKTELKNHPPKQILDESLLAGLEIVGDYYSKGKYFLPQMIASANAMKNGFSILKPLLAADADTSKGKVIICTVKGDIHDIGKNIVAMMFENHGFTVYDLGKDVDNETILNEAINKQADIVCLSSLLTTTMPQMKEFVQIANKNNLKAKVMIGGAVVTNQYAESIGAFYSKNAVEAVEVAMKIVKR